MADGPESEAWLQWVEQALHQLATRAYVSILEHQTVVAGKIVGMMVEAPSVEVTRRLHDVSWSQHAVMACTRALLDEATRRGITVHVLLEVSPSRHASEHLYGDPCKQRHTIGKALYSLVLDDTYLI